MKETLKVGALRRLRELPVLRRSHLVAQAHKYRLDAVLLLPLRQNGEATRINLQMKI